MNARTLIEADSDDQQHALHSHVTGYWGKRGAGSIIVARDTGRVLLPLRSDAVMEPGTWGTWGGAIDAGEDPAEAARREAREEAGATTIEKMIPLYVYRDGQKFTYFNFLAVVPTEFKPQLNRETEEARWVKPGEWPSPLHPGLRRLLADRASLEKIKVAV